MKLTDRIAKLTDFTISYEAKPLTEEDKNFKGEIIARYDCGGGVEYVATPNEHPFKSLPPHNEEAHPLFRILLAEVGDQSAWLQVRNSSLRRGVRHNEICVENHVILDFNAQMKYSFEMPSRDYLREKFIKIR